MLSDNHVNFFVTYCNLFKILLLSKLFLSHGTLIIPRPIIYFMATSPTFVRAPVASGAIILGINLVSNPAIAPKNSPF